MFILASMLITVYAHAIAIWQPEILHLIFIFCSKAAAQNMKITELGIIATKGFTHLDIHGLTDAHCPFSIITN